MLIVLFLGFSAGLPLALSGSTLLVWMREAGVDLGTIGLFALVGTPYTIKFLWAPVVDALDVPVLSRWLGRRRGWLVLSQLLLMAAIVLLGAHAIRRPRRWLVVFGAALLVAAASATQDIVIDAFRVESLDASEQAAGMASYVAAYRIGMLVSTAGALFIVSGFEIVRRSASDAAWIARLCRDGGLVRDRHGDDAARDRAGAIRSGAGRARRACRRESAQARRRGRGRRVLGIPHPRHGVRRARLRRALQVLRRASPAR